MDTTNQTARNTPTAPEVDAFWTDTAAKLTNDCLELAGRMYECCDIQRAVDHGAIKSMDELKAYVAKRSDVCDAEIKTTQDQLAKFGPLHLVTMDEAVAVRRFVVSAGEKLDSLVRWGKDSTGTDEWELIDKRLKGLAERFQRETEY